LLQSYFPLTAVASLRSAFNDFDTASGP
jgi:hypothetical protein